MYMCNHSPRLRLGGPGVGGLIPTDTSNSSYYLFGLDVYIDSAARAAGAQCLHRRCAWGGICLRVLPIQTGEDPLPHPTAGLPPVEPRP